MSAELGILLVHGIGSQNRGETITNMGEPLYRTLRKWIEEASFDASSSHDAKAKEPSRINRGGKVALVDAVLRPKDRSEPAHVRLSISTGHDSQPEEWVMAECHWAKSFPPPDHRDVTFWLMLVVPWVWTSFFSRRLRMAAAALGAAIANSPRRWLNEARLSVSILIALIALPLISPVVIGLELCLIVLLIAGLIPFGIVRDFVARINSAISAILGDTYIYASSAIRLQALISKIRADLDWLDKKGCKHLVVIGHSQGAALSYLSLRQPFPAKVRLLITFGSGLLKLHQLNIRQKMSIGGLAFMYLMAGLFSMFVAAAWLGLYTYPPGQESWIWPHTAVAGFLLVLTTIGSLPEQTDDIKIQASEYARHGLKWIDAYASMDPVPSGPLFLSPAPLPESVELCNDSSLIGDHTLYAKNEDEFLLMIIRAIGQYSGTQLPIANLTPSDEDVQLYAKRSRRIRIASSKIDQYILFASLIAFVLDLQAVKFVGTRLNEWINAVCATAALSSCWEWSPVATGLLVTIIAYVVLRMCVQGFASLRNYMTVEALYSRESGFSAEMGGCSPLCLVIGLRALRCRLWRFCIIGRASPGSRLSIS